MANEKNISVGVMEKDYALTWLLRGLYSNKSSIRKKVALKGGTAIRKVYFPGTWRFSEDLDFTVIEEVSSYDIKKSMENTFEKLSLEVGIDYNFESYHSNEGSVIAKVQFLGPLNHKNTIRHDISLNETLVLGPELQQIKSEFTDLADFHITSYSLKEIFIEKIRSIMQRGYSRDYYDVWRLMQETTFNMAEIKKLLIKKCSIKGVPYQPELIFDPKRISEVKNHWITSLGYLTRDTPKFGKVILELKKNLKL